MESGKAKPAAAGLTDNGKERKMSMENEDQLKEKNLLEQINNEEGPKLASEGISSETAAETTRSGPPTPQLADQGRKKSRKAILLGVAVIVVLAAAAAFYFLYLGNPSRQALAQVNGEKVTLKQFDNELSKVDNPLRDIYREEPDKFLEMIVVKMLLLQEARKQGVSASPKTYKDASKDALAPEESLIAEFMKKKFSSPPTVTREEIETFYSMFKDRMGGKPLKDVAPIIEQVIQQGKQQQEVEGFIGDLRKNAKVEINQDRLKKMAAKPPESNTEEEFKKAIASGKPVLVDFGANSCIPCRQMRPVLKEIGTEYSAKAKILVIDVYKFQDLARQYGVQLIPTLVFFDSKGKEAFRHLGILEKEKIVAKLKEIGMET
jgi:thioredoxin 1